MKAVVIIFPGSNRERDVCLALRRASGHEPLRVWHREASLPPADLIVLPGGFAYGDYLRCGAMAAHSPVMREVRARADRGTPVLGICNGFQVLTEAGMLPGALLPNRSLRLPAATSICGSRTIKRSSLAVTGGQAIRVPVAHHDGNYTADADTLDRLEGQGLVAFRYCAADGSLDEAANFNGSARAIAGIFNESRTVLGLTPHPENATDPDLGGTDGQAFFHGLVGALLSRAALDAGPQGLFA